MAGQRQPIALVEGKGKKHLTKAEIEERKNTEVVAPSNRVKPPAYLTPEQKKKFRKLAKELLEIKLLANVDCDALARLLIAQEQFTEVTEKIRQTPLMVQGEIGEVVNEERERLMIIQDRCMKQCRQGAADFGMTVSSRCRLVVPKLKDTKPENKFMKYAAKGAAG